MRRIALPLAILLAASPALAQPSAPLPHRVRLAYTAPATCPVEQVLRDLITGQNSSSVISPVAPARLTVALARHGLQYDGAAVLRDQADHVLWTRPFTPASSCSDLLQEVALTVSPRLDPSAPPPPSAPRAEIDAETPPPDSTPHADTGPASEEAYLFLFGLGSVVAYGAAPRVSVGVTADAGIRRPVAWGLVQGVSLSLGGRWDPPAAGTALDAPAGVRVTASRWLGTVAPCGHSRPFSPGWALYSCALGELGQLRHSIGDVTFPGARVLFMPRSGRGLESRCLSRALSASGASGKCSGR